MRAKLRELRFLSVCFVSSTKKLGGVFFVAAFARNARLFFPPPRCPWTRVLSYCTRLPISLFIVLQKPAVLRRSL